jgi:putative component of membrane protein insertase Oxa1/YidC/SpoIIIJ protein YidD
VKGFVKGFFMAVWRILRCHPFSKGGYDPVVKENKMKEVM